jgi:hypothetical protein
MTWHQTSFYTFRARKQAKDGAAGDWFCASVRILKLWLHLYTDSHDDRERKKAATSGRGFVFPERLLRDLAIDFAQTGCLAAQIAQVEQLGAANLVGANFLDLVHDAGVEWEDALDALAKAHLADGEGSVRSLAAGDHHTLKSLQALFIAFLDFDLDADGVAGSEGGEIGPLVLGGQLLHDGMD